MTDLATNEGEWDLARERALVWLEKAPEEPWGTLAEVHQDYTMFWLDRHQFPLWGRNVRELMNRWSEDQFSSAFSTAFDEEATT